MGKNPDSIRAFIAIQLPRELRARVLAHIDLLRGEQPDVRASWSHKDNLHLTLKFLGEIPVKRAGALSRATERAARRSKPFELKLSGCGTFPAQRRPQVLWLGVEDVSGGLTHLYKALEFECAQAAFPRELRYFHPHFTIARLKSAEGARELAELHRSLEFTPVVFKPLELIVFRSELLKQGSKHTPISRHRLP